MFDRASLERFRRDRPARRAAEGLALLFLLAVYAPFLAGDRPLLLLRDGAVEFPVLRHLFDRTLYESPVDLFFHPLVLELPLFALLGALARRRGLLTGSARLLAACLVHLAAAALLLAHPHSLPHRDYPAEVARARAEGRRVIALFPLVPRSPFSTDLAAMRPSPPEAAHPLGTDREGRDLFARLLFSLRGALLFASASVLIFSAAGSLLGALAGHFGGAADWLFLRLVETSLSLPPVLLTLVAVVALDRPGLLPALLVAGATLWTEPARVARAEYRRLRDAEFTLAARAAGASERRILLRHLLPNALPPVLVAAAFAAGQAVLVEAAVSFAGFHDPLRPGLGDLLALGAAERRASIFLPAGFTLFLLLALLNGLAEGARRALDPRSAGAGSGVRTGRAPENAHSS